MSRLAVQLLSGSWRCWPNMRRAVVQLLSALAALLPGFAGAACVEVIGHRGASGYLPEHTLPAYALAYGQGAHWIEPDLALSGDGVPIALHDLSLNRTTNVADAFPDRAREDGLHYAADFAYAEIRQLLVTESLPGRFPHASFRVPRFADVLALVDGLNRTSGRRVGIYPELKSPGVQPGLAAAFLEALAPYDLPVLVQSFDAAALAALQTEHPKVQLLDWNEAASEQRLDRIAAYAAGIGIHKSLLHEDSALAAKAHDRGLAVHAYTLRADFLGEGFDSFAEEVRALANLGADALFADHPDQALAALGSGACGPASSQAE